MNSQNTSNVSLISQIELRVNDVYLSTYHNGDTVDLFVIEEIVDVYVKVRKHNCGFTQFAKAEEFCTTVKAKYGTLRTKRWLCFEKEYIERVS